MDLIKENELHTLSYYKIIFVGDEDFKKSIEINKYPAVITNHSLQKKVGIVEELV